MKNYKNILLAIGVVIIIGLIIWISYGIFQSKTYKAENPMAFIEIEGMGTITLELYPDVAPESVKNFIALAQNGFYDGLTFHRVVKDFMVQGGDKKGDGTGSASLSDINTNIEKGSSEDKEYAITGEFKKNGIKNDLKFERGILAMARSDYSSISSSLATAGYNSASSQFFIVTKTTSSLNGNYAAFGRVVDGMDVVDKIEAVEIAPATEENSATDRPVNPPVITKITIDTKGVEYSLPKTLDTFDYSSWLQQYYGLSY